MIKNIKNIIAMMLVAMVGLTSCDYEYAQPPVNVPEGGIGTGAWDNPMTAYQCLIGSVNEDYPEPWVTGYIVGVVNVDISNVISEQCAQFEGPFTVATNLIIAVITAVIIVLAMNLVGSLLISALIIFPALSAMRIFRSFLSVTLCAAMVSVSCAFLGILISILAGTPVGSTVVAVDVAAFALCALVGKIRGE